MALLASLVFVPLRHVEALQIRRAKLEVECSEPAMLVADGFFGHFLALRSQDYSAKTWSEEHHCLLPLKSSGGWSPHSQPCDAVHHLFRRIANKFIDRLVGQDIVLNLAFLRAAIQSYVLECFALFQIVLDPLGFK